MGSVNSVPVVSQVKSAILYGTGNGERAKEVQSQFMHECPGASQVTSLVYVAKGDTTNALETQKMFGYNFWHLLGGVPVIGHVKGAAQYFMGDSQGAKESMYSATRTTAVISAAAFAGGPVGMIVGGIAGAAAADGTMTVLESRTTGTYQPCGVVASVEEVIKEPTTEKVIDAVAGVVMDGFVGWSAGQVDNAPATATRSQWRNQLRKAARAKLAGRPAPAPIPASVAVSTGSWFGWRTKTEEEKEEEARKNGIKSKY